MHPYLTGSLKVETLTLPIRDLPPDLQGLRLVQMSDFHFDGVRLSEDLLLAAIEAANAARPDLILLTGDFVTSDPSPAYGLARYLRALRARVGIYAVLGNHDLYWSTARATVTDALGRIGIRVLWNEAVYPLGPGLAVVGLPDCRTHGSVYFRPVPVMSQIPPEVPRLVLSHNPDSAAMLRRWRVDLQLSGHTHGGQVVLPILGPLPRWIERLIPWRRKVLEHWEWAEGLHAVGSNRLYVNRGLGTYLPGRLFCPPEVTVITLV